MEKQASNFSSSHSCIPAPIVFLLISMPSQGSPQCCFLVWELRGDSEGLGIEWGYGEEQRETDMCGFGRNEGLYWGEMGAIQREGPEKWGGNQSLRTDVCNLWPQWCCLSGQWSWGSSAVVHSLSLTDPLAQRDGAPHSSPQDQCTVLISPTQEPPAYEPLLTFLTKYTFLASLHIDPESCIFRYLPIMVPLQTPLPPVLPRLSAQPPLTNCMPPAAQFTSRLS